MAAQVGRGARVGRVGLGSVVLGQAVERGGFLASRVPLGSCPLQSCVAPREEGSGRKENTRGKGEKRAARIGGAAGGEAGGPAPGRAPVSAEPGPAAARERLPGREGADSISPSFEGRLQIDIEDAILRFFSSLPYCVCRCICAFISCCLCSQNLAWLVQKYSA